MKVTAVFASWSEFVKSCMSMTAIFKLWSIAVCLWDDDMYWRGFGLLTSLGGGVRGVPCAARSKLKVHRMGLTDTHIFHSLLLLAFHPYQKQEFTLFMKGEAVMKFLPFLQPHVVYRTAYEL
jgi:hypothetical protein